MGVLKVLVDGEWVEVGGGSGAGAEEVFVGPTDPGVISSYDLWYDTDAPPPVSIVGLPGGGLAGQVLSKLTSADFNTQWQTVKASAGNVYGVNMYNAALSSLFTVPQGAAVPALTIPLPAAPAGSLLDISWTCYCNCTVGTGSAFLSCDVNGVSQYPTVVVNDANSLMTYSGRVVNVAQPVGVPFNVRLMVAKGNAGGSVVLQTNNTVLSVVSYRP
jgi:hypothetical protein